MKIDVLEDDVKTYVLAVPAEHTGRFLDSLRKSIPVFDVNVGALEVDGKPDLDIIEISKREPRQKIVTAVEAYSKAQGW